MTEGAYRFQAARLPITNQMREHLRTGEHGAFVRALTAEVARMNRAAQWDLLVPMWLWRPQMDEPYDLHVQAKIMERALAGEAPIPESVRAYYTTPTLAG